MSNPVTIATDLPLSNTWQSLDPNLAAAASWWLLGPSLWPFSPSHLQCQATDATTTSNPAPWPARECHCHGVHKGSQSFATEQHSQALKMESPKISSA